MMSTWSMSLQQLMLKLLHYADWPSLVSTHTVYECVFRSCMLMDYAYNIYL